MATESNPKNKLLAAQLLNQVLLREAIRTGDLADYRVAKKTQRRIGRPPPKPAGKP